LKTDFLAGAILVRRANGDSFKKVDLLQIALDVLDGIKGIGIARN
jgi:hypothetical protein